MIPFMPSHIAEKISFTPVQAWSQFPVKAPIKISRSPVMMPRTVLRTVWIV
jgi:hypothetical protein